MIFRTATAREREIGLTVLRVVVGAIFIAHGVQKFFLLGIPVVTGGFAQAGLPMPSLLAPFIASVELLAGIALVAGLLTRLAALGTAFTMLGAMSLVHLKGGFFLPTGIEYTVALLAASLALILVGPGAFSLDALLARRLEPAWSTTRRAASRRAA
jgi:putative oxidoreductase